MRILVDADAAPIKNVIEEVASENKIEVFMYIDSSHECYSDYSKVVMINKGRDAVDNAIIEKVVKGDIVITNDYPLAALSLLKGAKVIGFSGLIYNNDNINVLLTQREISRKMRSSGKRGSNIKKRTNKDNTKFRESLCNVIKDNFLLLSK